VVKQLRSIEGGTYGKVNGARYVSAGQSDDAGTRYLQGAAVIMEVKTGDVIALIGGRDFLDSPFNRATQSRRQVGSAFKPFVYATAVAQGYAPSQHILDEPLTIQISRQVSWEPRNFDGQYYGEVSMREALTESRNIPTVRLARDVGLDSVRATAQRAGITGEMPLQPSMPLGTVVSSPLEMATAYTVFPGLGSRPEPRFLISVQDEDGKYLWLPEVVHEDGKMDPRVAYIMTDMMKDVVNKGTGAAVRSVGFYNAAAGKTGTTNEGADAWFVGYTPDLVGALWVGFDQRRSIVYNAQGGRLAAPVWGKIMRRVYADRPNPGDFVQPAGVVRLDIDPESGLALEEGCWPRYGEPEHEIFLSDHEPETICPNSGSWIGGILRGIGGIFNGGGNDHHKDQLDKLLDEADKVHPQARKLLGDWIDENVRRGVPRESEELLRAAQKWIDDLRRNLEAQKKTR
jgi:penicillin-binding protein 1A